MERFKIIYSNLLKHLNYIILGIITILIYAFFSGISVTFAVPLFDYVFKKDPSIAILYVDYGQFFDAVFDKWGVIINNLSFLDFFNAENLSKFTGSLKMIIAGTDSYLLLKMISIFLVVTILFKNIAYYLNRIIFANLRGKTILGIGNEIFSIYINQSIDFVKKYTIGDAQVRMVSDVEIISNMFIDSIFNSFRDIVTIIVYIFIALFLNWKLFFLSIAIVPIFTIIIGYIGNKIKKYSRRLQAKSADRFTIIEEVLNGIKIVKAFSKEKYEENKFKAVNTSFFKFWRKSVLYNALNVPLSEINSVFTGVIVLLLGGKFVLDPTNDFTFGTFTAFLFAIFSILHPVKQIAKAYNNIKKAMVSLERINEIILRKNNISEVEDAIEVTDFYEDISFRNINFSYDNETKVLDNINFSIKKGETVALVGVSGSGKTTLANLLLRLYDPTNGEIILDNKNLKDIKLSSLHSIIGTVTQELILFSGLVEDNIRYGTWKNVSDEQIKEAARIANADEFIEKMTKNYKHVLEPKAGNLSGGQKQRLSIARAIIGNPPILIFDEATSALDSEAEKKVQNAIDNVTKNRTVVVIAHRLSTILSADKIVVMDSGKILDIGKNDELLKRCEKYKTLYDLQFSGFKK